MKPIPSEIVKTYPLRGPMQQFRLAESAAFYCFRCGQPKKSKLITVFADDWSKRLCNGCYGRLLSIYDVKAGTKSDGERVDELAIVLLSAIDKDQQAQAERLLRASEKRAEYLSPEAVRFISTSEHVSRHLEQSPQLEWSPAVIGLCKSVELEVARLVLRPLAAQMSGANLEIDKRDKDFGKIAAFCADPGGRTPELGAVNHFLRTLANSQQRRNTSALLQGFLKMTSNWMGSHWILDEKGFADFLQTLTINFRNRAAHTDELGQEDYVRCRELVMGAEGGLWSLLVSTAKHR
jgi:hypothetical protein